MSRFVVVCGGGLAAACLLKFADPIGLFTIACLVFLSLAVLLFLLFHLGVQDFQGY